MNEKEIDLLTNENECLRFRVAELNDIDEKYKSIVTCIYNLLQINEDLVVNGDNEQKKIALIKIDVLREIKEEI